MNKLTFGQKCADKIAEFGGSWTFIGSFMFGLASWILLNTFILHHLEFDPYPYILLNLFLSCIAAIQAPIIMMSQNRADERDRQLEKEEFDRIEEMRKDVKKILNELKKTPKN